MASVLRPFRDKESGEVFASGDIFLGTKERIRHLTALAFVQPIPDEEEQPEEPVVVEKPKRRPRSRGKA